MATDEIKEITELQERLHQRDAERAENKEAIRIFQLLPQGEGSGLDADLLDGKDAQEIIEEAVDLAIKNFPPAGGGGGGGGVECAFRAGAIWDVLAALYQDEGTFGKLVQDIYDKVDALGGGVSSLSPLFGEIVVYPWAGTSVLNADPTYSYGTEKSEPGTDYVEVDYFDFNEDTADIKSLFVHLLWSQKITGSGSGKVKWQIASGSHASPGSYVDITDEVEESDSSYQDHGRSGVVHKITSITATIPFTIRCLVKNVDATSAEAKIKSNSYIRAMYKRTS